jgi:hypothetical protein
MIMNMETVFNRKGLKLTAILATSFFVASLIPILALSLYARAADDDFSYGAWPRQAWVASGSLIEVLKASAQKVASVYESWQGTWFSLFVFTLQPEVFSEKAYFMVTPVIILLWVGVVTFVMHYFLVRLAGFGKYSFLIVNFAFIWLNMQYIPSPFSSLTWYNGIMHYQFPFLLNIFLLYLLTRYGQEHKHTHLIGCAVIMAGLGGSNYLSALFALLITVLIMAGSYWLKHQKKTLLLLIPLALLLVGLAVSMAAPGNKIRGGADFGFSFARAIRTIGAAVVSSVTQGGAFLGERPWVVIGLVFILILAAYDMYSRPQKHTYPYPALFCLLVYGVYAASYAPEIYAAVPATTGTDNINYQLLLLMILANGIYLLGYGKRVFGDKGGFLNNPRFIIAGAGICLVLAGVSYRAAFDTVAYQSYRLIKTGQAADYKRLAALRTQIMLDDSIRAVVLPAVYDDYSPLKAVSLETDPENWTNRALRDFYGKDSVTAIDKNEWIEMYGRW